MACCESIIKSRFGNDDEDDDDVGGGGVGDGGGVESSRSKDLDDMPCLERALRFSQA